MEKNNSYLNTLDTEQVNKRSRGLDSLSGLEIAELMNAEDRTVADAVAKALPAIGQAIDLIADRLERGGRLLYIGAGTSGRLGVLDASECPPTFGVAPDIVRGIIAGGDVALRNSVESAEDDPAQGQADLQNIGLREIDTVAAISASGYAPYCRGALDYAASVGALTIAITCNRDALLSRHAQLAIVAETGPEVLQGSTRLKAGTASKMILNMLSTGVMVRNGHVYQNLMVDVVVSNSKLEERAVRIIRQATGSDEERARCLLRDANGSAKAAIVMELGGCDYVSAEAALLSSSGRVAAALQMLR